MVPPLWTLLYAVMVGLIVLVYRASAPSRAARGGGSTSSLLPLPALGVRKLLFVLFIAAFLADRLKRIEDITTPLLAIALAIPPVLLVFLQPDLGSGLVYFAALAACLFVAGVRWLHLAILGGGRGARRERRRSGSCRRSASTCSSRTRRTA